MEKNKNKLWLTPALIISVIFIIFSLGIFYYVKQVVRPDHIKATIEKTLSKSLPGANVKIKSLKVDYGTYVTIRIEDFEVSQLRPVLSNDFLSVSHVNIEVPIWAILTGGGKVDITFESPRISIQQIKDNKNWINIFNKKDPENPISKDRRDEENAQIVVPVFLLNSTMSLRMRDSKLSYQIEDEVGELLFSKLLFKNVGLNTLSAFEVKSSYISKAKDNEKADFSLNTTLIGSIDFANYLNTHDLKVKSNIKVENLVYSEKVFPLDLIKIDLFFILNKEGNLKGEMQATSLENELRANFNLEKDKVLLSKIKGNLLLDNFKTLYPDNNLLNFESSHLNLKGRLEVNNGVLNPALELITSSLEMKLLGKTFANKNKFKFLKDEIHWNVELKEDEELIESKGKADFIYNSKLPLHRRMEFYDHKITLRSTEFSSKKISQFIGKVKKGGALDNFLLPRGVNNVTVDKIKVNGEVFSGGLTLNTMGNKEVLKNFSLISENSKIQIEGNQTRTKNKTKIYPSINISTSRGEYFFSEFLKPSQLIKGNLKSKIQGNWVLSDKNTFETQFNLEMEDGELKGFKTSEFLKKIKGSLKSSLGGLKYLAYKSDDINYFKRLEAGFTLRDSNLNIKSLRLFPSESFFVGLKGDLDLDGVKETSVRVNLFDEEYQSKFLTKKTRFKKTIPLRMKAFGWELENDMVKTYRGLIKRLKFKKDRTAMRKKLLVVAKNLKRKKSIKKPLKN